MSKKLITNTINSYNGLRVCLKEHSFRLECYLLTLGCLVVPFINQVLWLKVAGICTILLTMVAEALNTGLEILCDRITLETDVQIKQVKDVGSAAVFLALLIAIITWVAIVVT